MSERPPPPSECAQCGAEIPPRARACPGCGADERTGWRESSVYDGIELPDSAWADEDEVTQRRASLPPRRVNGMAWYWWCVALAVLLFIALRVLNLR